jgi:hypothetical protein
VRHAVDTLQRLVATRLGTWTDIVHARGPSPFSQNQTFGAACVSDSSAARHVGFCLLQQKRQRLGPCRFLERLSPSLGANNP